MEDPGVVLVMGMTGAGKSTFISRLKTSSGQVQIGHGLESKTADLAVYEASSPGNPNRPVLLADAPGFNDTVRSDTDILQDIITPLYELQKKKPILGIIYLHNITKPRLAGTALRMLKMLQQFCGEANYKRIVFATTMWQDANFTPHGAQAANQRQEELKREFWDVMFADNGGVVCHLQDDPNSAGVVLDHFFHQFDKLKRLDRERPLKVFDEMIKNRLVEKTSAYQCAHEEQRLQRQQKAQQLADLEEQRRQLIGASKDHLAFGYFYVDPPKSTQSQEVGQTHKNSETSKPKWYLFGLLRRMTSSKDEKPGRSDKKRELKTEY